MPDLAEYIQELLFPHKVELDYDWGFDHGAGVC
jgi:aromatic ring-opening dioxygenase catalytic subunit (LigB family)